MRGGGGSVDLIGRLLCEEQRKGGSGTRWKSRRLMRRVGWKGGAGSDVSPTDVVRSFAERRLTFLLVIYLIVIDN